jgi:hypothetical protein
LDFELWIGSICVYLFDAWLLSFNSVILQVVYVM